MNTATFRKIPNVTLAAIPPEAWGLLRFPAYQRKPTSRKVKDIAKGLRDGYQTAPIILYKSDDAFQIEDGGYPSAPTAQLRDLRHRCRHPGPDLRQDAIDQNHLFAGEQQASQDTNSDKGRQYPHLLQAAPGNGARDKSPWGPPIYGLRRSCRLPLRPLTCHGRALPGRQGLKIQAQRPGLSSVIRALDRLEQAVPLTPQDSGEMSSTRFLRYCSSYGPIRAATAQLGVSACLLWPATARGSSIRTARSS